MDRIKQRCLQNVVMESCDVSDPHWRHVDFPSVPTFRIWAQNEYIMETTSWERAVEKCAVIAQDPITRGAEYIHSGDLASARECFSSALLLGKAHKCKARLGLLRCAVGQALAGVYDPEIEYLVADLRAEHETEFEQADFELVLQAELIIFKETDACHVEQKKATEQYLRSLRLKSNTVDSADGGVGLCDQYHQHLSEALERAISHYHAETKESVARHQRILDLSQRKHDAEDYVLDRLVTLAWIRDRNLGNQALFKIEHGLTPNMNNPTLPWKHVPWTPFKPRICRTRTGGQPRLLRNRKWAWLGPDTYIINTKKTDSGFA